MTFYGNNFNFAGFTSGINLAPIADAGPDQSEADLNGSGDHVITLDGSGSSDPEGGVLTYSWTESSVEIATGVAPTPTFTVGSHTVVLTVTDDGGLTDTDTVIIEVTPAVSGSPDAWYKADALDLEDSADVDTWVDSSGNGRTLTKDSGAPTFNTNVQNGLPGVHFTGDTMSNDSGFPDMSGVGTKTTFIVIAFDAGFTTEGLFSYAPEINVFNEGHMSYTSGGTIINNIYASDDSIKASTFPTFTPTTEMKQYTIKYDKDLGGSSGGAWLARNGVHEDFTGAWTQAMSTSKAIDCFILGGISAGGYALSGTILECISYSEALSEADMAANEAYLMAKWGIT